MSRFLLATFVVGFFASPSLIGQATANFSGTWTLVPSRSHLDDNNPEVTRAMIVVISQRDSEILVDTMWGATHDRVTYRFGPIPRGGVMGSQGSILSWEGGSLRTVLSRMVSDAAVSILEERRLSPDGREMTVSRQLAVEHGYQGQGVNTSEVVTDVYVRKSQ
ncbi:MAG: hypothetical protein AB7P99_07425 [Vicinamibacterales bacterium]